jgi:hypothetical protein
MKKLNSFVDVVKHQSGYVNHKASFTYYQGLFEGIVPTGNPDWIKIKFGGKLIPSMYHKGIVDLLLKYNGKELQLPFYTPAKFNAMYGSTNPKHYSHLS